MLFQDTGPVEKMVYSYAATVMLCRMKRNEQCIEFLGRNSLIVLCTHMFFIEVIRLLDYKLFDNVLYTLGILEGVVFGMLVVGLMFPVIAVSNRYLRKLYGK